MSSRVGFCASSKMRYFDSLMHTRSGLQQQQRIEVELSIIVMT